MEAKMVKVARVMYERYISEYTYREAYSWDEVPFSVKWHWLALAYHALMEMKK